MYKKQWLGICVDKGTTLNLKEGEIYLLKDKRGVKEHFYVSRFISPSDSFIGAYNAKYFKVFLDVTEEIKEINSEPHTRREIQYARIIQLVSKVKGVTLVEAETYLVKNNYLKERVLNSSIVKDELSGKVTKQVKKRQPKKEVPKEQPKKEVTQNNEKPRTTGEKVKEGTNIGDKPKTPAEPKNKPNKLVQKSLFG